jgi:hypothetical protein
MLRNAIRDFCIGRSLEIDMIVTSYSPAIAAPAKTPSSKIAIFYKGAEQTPKDKSTLSQGDALLTGTNIQISIEGLNIGNYSLLMEKDGKERTTLAEQIKIDKKTKVLIPSADKWLTISNNTGNYNTMSGTQNLAIGNFNNNDYALIRLYNNIPSSYNAYYAGWNRSSSNPGNNIIGIHHPDGGIKKIAYDAYGMSSSGNWWDFAYRVEE